ncbi:protein split ends-like [Uloborus diversus]|uniref:protein split ends-like n=1 Tax=Uloborus diversus TaxID=327109 RepID=UPI0024099E2D|nr:protein split ends-like [Uloborus diversus]
MVRETRHLWVGNLPHTIREERILDHFKRYGKVQSVKILPKKEDESGGSCATVAFIDIKSAAKAHNADNKIDDRTLKTDYYEPPASSTASSAIYIHERDDALVRPAAAPYAAPRTPRYGLSEERNYERPGHYYGDREPYARRPPLGLGYHDEDGYPARAKSRDRYARTTPSNTYAEGSERNQNHFRPHNARQHFEPQRYPVGEQYNDDRDPAAPAPRLNRRTNNAAPSVASVASPTPARSESRSRRTKRRSPSRTSSGSRSDSPSRSRSRSSSDSRSSSSSSKMRSSSSDSSGRSRSPSKSRSPAASYGSQGTAKAGRQDRPSSAIANPSGAVCYLPSAVNAPSNCVPGLPPGCPLEGKDERRPLGICVRNLPVRSTDTSLKDGLFHEYKKHGKVTMVKVIGQGTDRYAVVCFKKPEDVDKALEVSKDKLFFGCKIEVTAHEGLDAEDNEFRPLEAELDEYHPKATRTLFIGNLEKDITTNELRKHFDQFGEIIEIDIKKQGSATSYAFIQYSDIASVVKAMRKLDGENLGANRIKLGFGKSMPTNCVWLDGIVDTISDKFLSRHFSRFGGVTYTAIDREKGHALVFYEAVEFAQIGVSEMRGRILQGKKLQVDFASRECQTTFFDKLEMTGQMVPGDGTRPWERRERRGPEFEVLRSDDREPRVGFENRVYPRYEGQTRPGRGNFRGQRAGFPGRGRGQNFPNRYEVYHDEFGERRHRYNSRDESTGEVPLFDGKIERVKYGETTDCPNRKRNKLRNSISDQESHPSQSPPRSRHQSRSTSPVSKERKSLKDRVQHRTKSPGSQNSSLVSSPCRESISDDIELNSDYRDSRVKSSDSKADDALTDASYASPRSGSEKDGPEKFPSKLECDSFRSRNSVDSETADEAEGLGQSERKKRLLGSANIKATKELSVLISKSLSDKAKLKIPANLLKGRVNCLVEGSVDDFRNSLDGVDSEQECAKDKLHQGENTNTELKYLQKKQVQLLHLLEQLHDNVNLSDTEGSIDGDRLVRKKNRSSSICLDALGEGDLAKSLTKDEAASKLLKGGIKDPTLLNKLKKTDGVDCNNCISLSLDSFVFRKHLDPRKGFDAVSVNAFQKCRRISMDNDTCLPNTQGSSEAFLCLPAEVSWKKQTNDIHFSENDDVSLSMSHSKDDEEVSSSKKSHLSNSSSQSDSKPFLSLRTFSEGSCHEIKRERDISPLSLPLPKFAASLRSPKSSPSVHTSPKSTSAHSPRAGFSPSYASSKNVRIPDFLHDIPNEKKLKDPLPEEKVNGANVSPVDSASPTESRPAAEISDSVANLEPIQSPKISFDKHRDSISSSESDFSPSSSPSRPSFDDRIKALDEKFNVWSGSTRTPTSATLQDSTNPPAAVDVPKSQIKRSRFNFISPEIRTEPSDIVKSILAKSTIFDQDSKRLQNIDEKYEPLNVKMDLSPKAKPTFRTKAAAKEFSMPIAPSLQTFSQPLSVKSNAVLLSQGIISPPTTPQSGAGSLLSPITPPLQQFVQTPSTVFTPCSPLASSFSIPSSNVKVETVKIDTIKVEKESSEPSLKSPILCNSIKPKVEPTVQVSTALTTGKSCSLTSPITISAPILLPNIKKEPLSPTSTVDSVCTLDIDANVSIKKEIETVNSVNISTPKDCSTSVTKDFPQLDSEIEKKEFCDSRDPRLSFHESRVQWTDSDCKEDGKTHTDASAKSFNSMPCSDPLETSLPAQKKRVSSVDSNESDSSKSLKSLDSSRDSHETTWTSKQDKTSEPETKKIKLSKSVRDRSLSPPSHQGSKKSDKKDKMPKIEKNKSCLSKSNSLTNSEKSKTDAKCSSSSSSSKTECKDKPKLEHKSKEEKRFKSRESKDCSSKSEQKSKSRERRNSDKETKNSHSNPNKPKKESSSSSKSEKSSEKKQTEKKSRSKSSSSNFDFAAFMDEEPVYFSMYDKVKARSNKSQTLKQTNDLETVRKKFSKLKQSRAKREEKSKSIDQDSDKDSDSCSHHSSDSDSQAKSVKVKQQRKRKLVIQSSSDDDTISQNMSSHINKTEKDFSDSATDSEFEYNVPQRQMSSGKSRKKKTEILDSDSSDSDLHSSHSKLQSSSRKKMHGRSKQRSEKSKKILKSDEDNSEIDTGTKNKEKEYKTKKMKKEKNSERSEHETAECDKKNGEEQKSIKKKHLKELKLESDVSISQKKVKTEHTSKERNVSSKEKKRESSVEKMQIDDSEKHKPYSKKRKKSKKMSRNKEKRNSGEKMSHDSLRKQHDESDTKSSLPILLSPKPSSPLADKPLSPPCLQAGILSDNDFKSDFSDFDFEPQPAEEMDLSSDLWKQLETKYEPNSEKSPKNKCKESNVLKAHSVVSQSPEQDSSLPSFFDKLSDITDSETGKELADCPSDVPGDSQKHLSYSPKKEKGTYQSTPSHKSRHEKHDDQSLRQDSNKYSDGYSCSSKEERRKKKSKKQSKDRKKKVREEFNTSKEVADSVSVPSPKTSLLEALPGDEDSRLSDIRLDEEIAEEARRLEEELLAASEETSTFGDDGPAKKEEKLLERRFEEEAAKETRRLEAELFSTGRDSWHMKEKVYDSEVNPGDLCEDKHMSSTGKEDNIFAGLDMHSSVNESSQNDGDVFLSGHSETDPYKIDDKDVSNEIEDQRKIEDDLAVSALLQEMHCGEIPAPELTKETDYLDMEGHPEDTMNYLLPDDGENSLHIADSPSEDQGSEGHEAKLESSVIMLSPSPNSEPPALEISNLEDSVLMKIENVNQPCSSEALHLELMSESAIVRDNRTTCYNFEEPAHSESKPPVINIPTASNTLEQTVELVSPKVDTNKIPQKRPLNKFRMPSKVDLNNQSNEETDNESNPDLAENQLTHFEDITMDTADSKDDDNPPILLPVESPRNLLSVTEAKEKMEPLSKVDVDNNPSLDSIICKASASSEGVLELDKQIGEIINSITEFKKQNLENGAYRIQDSHERTALSLSISELTDTASNDSLGMSASGIFKTSKLEEHETTSSIFNAATVIKPVEKLFPPVEYNVNTFSDENISDKFKSCKEKSISETPLLNYTDVLSSCETSVIQSPRKTEDSNQVDLPDKREVHNNEPHTAQTDTTSFQNQESSDNFLLELFAPKSDSSEKIQNVSVSDAPKNNSSFECSVAELKKKIESEITPPEINLHPEITPLFEIPEVNEQNEATEFNQELFEPTSDTSKDSKIPPLLNFSSQQLFNDDTSQKKVPSDMTVFSPEKLFPTVSVTPDYKPSVAENSQNNNLSFCSSYFNDSEKVPDENLSIFREKNCEDLKESSLNIEDNLCNKSRPGDAESVCSDTTDITIPDTKVEVEVNQAASSEEPNIEDTSTAEEPQLPVENKVERPKRGRRPNTRKFSESAVQKQDAHNESTATATPHGRNARSHARAAAEKTTRRSLRSNASEAAVVRDPLENKNEEVSHSENEDHKKDPASSSDMALVSETDSGHGIGESKGAEKSLSGKNEEPKRRRGRRKKVPSPQPPLDKLEHKSEEVVISKDYHRPKESRFWASSAVEKEQKNKKDDALDIFEFREEDEEDLKFEIVKERLHDNTRGSVSAIDQKHDKHDLKGYHHENSSKVAALPLDLKHEKHDKRETKERTHETAKISSFSVDVKHEKHEMKERFNENIKVNPSIDAKHEKSDAKEWLHESSRSSMEARSSKEAVAEQKHEKHNKHESKSSILSEKERKIDEPKAKSHAKDEDKDNTPKESHAEANPKGKLLITLRLHPKNGHDGNSECTFEVVKRSDPYNIDDAKPETKAEKATSSKQEVSAPEATHSGPRKSPRLANQALRSTHAEESSKGNSKNSRNKTGPRRGIQRPRSSRHSEEMIATTSENSEDNSDCKNKNEPMFVILDNDVNDIKDVAENKKNISYSSQETTANAEVPTPKSSKVPDRVASLRSYRKPQSNTNKPETSKDSLLATPSDHEQAEKESSHDEKSDPIPPKECRQLKNEQKVSQDTSFPKVELSRLPKAELQKVVFPIGRTPSNEEDNESGSSPIARIESYKDLPSAVPKNDPFAETSSVSLKIDDAVINNPESSSTEVATPISLIPKTTIEPVAVSSVIQESSKIQSSFAKENPVVEGSNPVQKLQSKLLPTPTRENTCITKENRKLVEPVKPQVKKDASAAVGVVTMASSVTVPPALPICSEPSMIINPHGHAPALAVHTTSADSMPQKIVTCQSSHVPSLVHSYQAPAKVIGSVVTPSSSVQVASLPSNAQTKCSNPSNATPPTISELPIECSASSILPHASTNISCKPVSLITPATSEHSIISATKQDVRVRSSPNPPVAWPGSKVPSSRVADAHVHVSTIQNNAISNPTPTAKSETRSSKVNHSLVKPINASQPAFPTSKYEASVLSNAHGIALASNSGGGVIAELLQNPQLLQQQHKEYCASSSGVQLQDRIQSQMVRATTPSSIPSDLAIRFANPTPPDTPTPPIASSNLTLPPVDIHSPHVGSALHLQHSPQSSLIVPQHHNLGLHPNVNAYVHQQLMFANFAAIHPDFRAQETQARAAMIGMNPRVGYSAIHPTAVPPNSFRPPSDHRLQQPLIDAKSDPKLNDLSKIHENRIIEEKPYSMKSSKKDDASIKIIDPESREEDVRRISTREKNTSSAITPRSLRQQAHYSSSPRPTISPHDRTTESPGITNLYAAGRDHKQDNLGSLSLHHFKGNPQPAHQAPPSTIPFHTLDSAVLPGSRLGVLPPTAGHLDGRSSNPAPSPSSLAFKKDLSHSQQMSSLHNPASDKRAYSEHSKNVLARTIPHQGSSISPDPRMGPAQSPVSWSAVIQSHNSHPSLTQSPHVLMSANEPSSRRSNPHLPSQMGSDVPINVPPPAHAMSQPTSVPRLPQTPPQASQVDAYLYQRYPVMWQGILALKNDQAAVQMHFVSGNPNVAKASLPPPDGESSVRIAQRMRLEPQQLDGVYRKIQISEEHCILMALPCGKDQNEVPLQSNNLKTGFINYLQSKQAAGIVNAPAPGFQNPAYVIHIFPPCEFIDSNMARIAPDLLQIACEIAHLVIIIATV